MMNILALEALADQVIRDRRQAADRQALANLLPGATRPRPPLGAARRHLASALRGLACRLDPGLGAAERPLATAHPR